MMESDSSKNFIFIKSQQNREALLIAGYRHTLGFVNKGGSSRWRCINRDSCSATVTINKERNKILRQVEHTCKPNYIKNNIDVVMDKCKDIVCKNYEPVQKIFEEQFRETYNEDFVPNFQSKKDTLRRARRHFLNVQRTEFDSLNDIKIPEILARDFLVCEDGINNDKILLFCTTSLRINIKYLKDHLFFIDGTFSRTPKPFYQIISIHVDIDSNSETSNVVGIIYALLPNKLQITYERLFQLIKQHLDITINKIKCDFEIGITNALKKVFPDILISGCYYHFHNAIWRKAKALNITDTKESRSIIRICANFPLLPSTHYSECWLHIKEHALLTDGTRNFLNYFENQWLKASVNISCYNEKFRTNNPLEGWNRRFSTKLSKKPTLLLFLDALRKEAKWQEIRYKNSLFHSSKRRKIDISFNLRYNEEKKKLEEDLISPYEFLKRISKIKYYLNID